jgi:aspartate/methionine/tyrosine aminotransferase
VNAPTQWAGIAALKGPQDAVDVMNRAFDERRKAIVAALNKIPGFRCVMPKGAFYAFPNISGTGLGAKDVQNLLLDKAGVATVAGTSFGAEGEGYVRFSYANSLENIRKAMDRIGAVMAERNMPPD